MHPLANFRTQQIGLGIFQRVDMHFVADHTQPPTAGGDDFHPDGVYHLADDRLAGDVDGHDFDLLARLQAAVGSQIQHLLANQLLELPVIARGVLPPPDLPLVESQFSLNDDLGLVAATPTSFHRPSEHVPGCTLSDHGQAPQRQAINPVINQR